MTKKQFLLDLQNGLQREKACAEKDTLAEYEEWDSLSQIYIISYFDDKLKTKITMGQICQAKTVTDLISLAGAKIQ